MEQYPQDQPHNDSGGADFSPPPPIPPEGNKSKVFQDSPPPSGPWFIPVEKKTSGLRKFFRVVIILLFVASVIINISLLGVIGSKFDTSLQTKVVERGKLDEKIATYTIAGIIDDKAASWFSSFYRTVINDSSIKAVVIRVNSPGGSVSASDQIYNKIKSIKEIRKIPVVVSMGTLAASGGYYISAPADHIYAEPTTITGSIGVIMSWPVLKGTFEKIGVDAIVMRSTNSQGWKDEISQVKHPDARQREHLQETLDKMQHRFEQIITDRRGDRIKFNEISYPLLVSDDDGNEKNILHTEKEPFNGKIYLAQEALELGLIDDIGYLENAVEYTKTTAKLKNPTIEHYQPRRGFMSNLLAEGSIESPAQNLVDAFDKLRTPKIEMIWRP